jgi:hypothetical protein
MPVAAAAFLVTALAIPAPAIPATSAVEAVSVGPHPDRTARHAITAKEGRYRGSITPVV